MSRAAARMHLPIRPRLGPHDLPGFSLRPRALPEGARRAGVAELVASTAGPLDAAIAELRARYDIEQLTPPGNAWSPVSAPARLWLTPRLPLAPQSPAGPAGQAIDAVIKRVGAFAGASARTARWSYLSADIMRSWPRMAGLSRAAGTSSRATAGAGRAARRGCDAGHGNEGCPGILFRARGPVRGGTHDDHYSAAWREPGPGWPGCQLPGRFAVRSRCAAVPARPRGEAPSGDGAGGVPARC